MYHESDRVMIAVQAVGRFLGLLEGEEKELSSLEELYLYRYLRPNERNTTSYRDISDKLPLSGTTFLVNNAIYMMQSLGKEIFRRNPLVAERTDDDFLLLGIRHFNENEKELLLNATGHSAACRSVLEGYYLCFARGG